MEGFEVRTELLLQFFIKFGEAERRGLGGRWFHRLGIFTFRL